LLQSSLRRAVLLLIFAIPFMPARVLDQDTETCAACVAAASRRMRASLLHHGITRSLDYTGRSHQPT
jgi:hypothetical protein